MDVSSSQPRLTRQSDGTVKRREGESIGITTSTITRTSHKLRYAKTGRGSAGERLERLHEAFHGNSAVVFKNLPALAMELKAIGISERPMIVAQDAEELACRFSELYPMAYVLRAETIDQALSSDSRDVLIVECVLCEQLLARELNESRLDYMLVQVEHRMARQPLRRIEKQRRRLLKKLRNSLANQDKRLEYAGVDVLLVEHPEEWPMWPRILKAVEGII